MNRTTDTPMDDDDRAKARDHMRAARQEWRESIAALFPRDFVQHMRRARREMLLARRSMIDHAIQRMDEKNTTDTEL